MIDQLEQAQSAYDAALASVVKGEQWFKDNKPTHPQYSQAQKLLTQRRLELDAAQRALDAAVSDAELDAALAEHGWTPYTVASDKPASLNCVVCGKPVHGWPPPTPGHFVHFGCMVK